MCKSCIATVRPDKGRICRDQGVDILNFKACSQCGVRDVPVGVDREVEEDDDPEHGFEETIEYKREFEWYRIVALPCCVELS